MNCEDSSIESNYSDVKERPGKPELMDTKYYIIDSREPKQPHMYKQHEADKDGKQCKETREKQYIRQNTYFTDRSMRRVKVRHYGRGPMSTPMEIPGHRGKVVGYSGAERRNTGRMNVDVSNNKSVKGKDSKEIEQLKLNVSYDYFRQWIYSGEDPMGVLSGYNDPRFWPMSDGTYSENREDILKTIENPACHYDEATWDRRNRKRRDRDTQEMMGGMSNVEAKRIEELKDKVDYEYYWRWIYAGEDPMGVLSKYNNPRFWPSETGSFSENREDVLKTIEMPKSIERIQYQTNVA